MIASDWKPTLEFCINKLVSENDLFCLGKSGKILQSSRNHACVIHSKLQQTCTCCSRSNDDDDDCMIETCVQEVVYSNAHFVVHSSVKMISSNIRPAASALRPSLTNVCNLSILRCSLHTLEYELFSRFSLAVLPAQHFFYSRKQLLLSVCLSNHNSVRSSVCHMGGSVKNGAS